jgi:hypothetical protein
MIRASVISAAAVLIVAVAPARAGDLVVESHGTSRPAEADKLLGPVIEALVERGFERPKASGALIEARHSAPSRILDDEEIAAAQRFIDSGYRQFQDVNFESAVKDARDGLEVLDGGLATLIQSPDLRDLRQRALITLALAANRLGRATETRAATGELIRAFTDRPINTAVYSPEVTQLTTKHHRELAAGDGATLAVVSDDPSAVVFINEVYSGVGRAEKTGQFPGVYRIALRKGSTIGRIRRVTLSAGETKLVPISWAQDEALRTDEQRVELRWSREEDRAAGEAALARALATSTGSERVVVLAIRSLEGRRSVVGTVYHAARSTPSGAFVTAEPTLPGADRLAALGRFLGGDESAASLVERFGEPATAGAPAPPADRGDGDTDGGEGGRFAGWLTLGLGAAAIATGGVLIAIHEPEREGNVLQPDARNTRTPGIVTAAAGAAAVGLGLYLVLRGDDERGPSTAFHVAPTRGGLQAGWTARF